MTANIGYRIAWRCVKQKLSPTVCESGRNYSSLKSCARSSFRNRNLPFIKGYRVSSFRNDQFSQSCEDERLKDFDWTGEFVTQEPDFDWSYLTDPKNTDIIRNNISDRLSTGNIDRVVQMRQQFLSEKDEVKREILRSEMLKAASEIPNNTHQDSPIGDESHARLVKTLGTKRDFSFAPKSAVDLGENLGLLRTKNVVSTTGERTYYFIDDLALLEQALVKFAVQKLVKLGFQLVSVPDLIHPRVIEGAGFPTEGERTQVYSLDSKIHEKASLSGTAEMPLCGFFSGEILKRHTLPQKLCAVSRCYRAETSNLLEEKGIYRVHQFTKVEMFAVTSSEKKGIAPKSSDEILQSFVEIQQNMFSELGLHCRVLDMPTEELGAPAFRKFDIEAWMPNKEMWGEISSASNCTDFQSRRLNIRYRCDEGVKFVHTVNGTACAVPRLIIALLENGQNSDGTIDLPAALIHNMNGKSKLVDKTHLVPSLIWQKKAKK